MPRRSPTLLAILAAESLAAGCIAVGPDALVDDPSGGGAVVAGEGLAIHIRANTTAFPHADGLSGETALFARGGVRSLRLLRATGDPAPVTVFDYGADAVEVGYDAGDDTVAARIDPAALPPGEYVLARMVQIYSRFRIAGTLHEGLSATSGVFDEVVVTSNGTRIGGAVRDAGWIAAAFEAPGRPRVTLAGDFIPVAPLSTTAGAWAVEENGEWAVYFPIHLQVATGLTAQSTLTIDVNMDHSFRWSDVALPGWEPGVFDATPISWEPVIRFGGNRFDVSLE